LSQGRAFVEGPNKDTESARKALDLAIGLARLLDHKKGDHVEILDLRQITIIADFFVFASGFARVQIQALADAALEEAKKTGHSCRSVEGYEDSGWILLDLGDVIVHLLTEESRDYYRLDRLWGDAPKVVWTEGGGHSTGSVHPGE
jgi:ribosome-associated protein